MYGSRRDDITTVGFYIDAGVFPVTTLDFPIAGVLEIEVPAAAAGQHFHGVDRIMSPANLIPDVVATFVRVDVDDDQSRFFSCSYPDIGVRPPGPPLSNLRLVGSGVRQAIFRARVFCNAVAVRLPASAARLVHCVKREYGPFLLCVR